MSCQNHSSARLPGRSYPFHPANHAEMHFRWEGEGGWNPTLKMCLDIQRPPDNRFHPISMGLCFYVLQPAARMRGWRGKGGFQAKHK